MLIPRTRRVNDAGINPFSILDILSGNRLYFFTAPRHLFQFLQCSTWLARTE